MNKIIYKKMHITRGSCPLIVYKKDYEMKCGKIAHCLAMRCCGEIDHISVRFSGGEPYLPYRETLEVNIQWLKDLAKELEKIKNTPPEVLKEGK